MRSLKKGLALVCMLAMLAQLIFAVPVVSAAEPSSYDVVFLSDLHNGVGGYNGFKQMMTELKNEGQNPRVLSHGGDYVEDDMGGQPDWQTQVFDVISGTEKAAFPDAKQVYTLGNHDFESGTFGGRTDKEAAFEEIFGFPRCGLAYADDELEIYMIGAQGVTGAGGGGEAFIQADIDAFDQYLSTKVGSKKVIFLQTHWPAHSSYNFKQRVVTNSDKLIDVLNKYGDDMDLVWIWGHNHYEDAMRYVILQPGEQIMYAADTSGSSWGNPVNPQYKTIKFTYANCGCMNDMWWHHDGHNDTNAAGNYRGPSACLSVAVDQNTVTYTYNRIKQDDAGNWVYSHDANLQIYNHNILMEHPATVVVDRVTLDHEHDYEVSRVVEPTCTEGGYTVEKCKICGRERTVNPTEALGHAWDEGVETVAPTVEKAGQMTYTCSRCGETRTARIPRLPGGSLADIDFTDPADEGKFDVENKDSAAIVEGAGLTLTPTADAFEPIGGGFGGGEATPSAPKDLIKVPVNGDWTATVQVAYDQNAVTYAFNSYFSILAMQDEDYQNMAGIRGTNNVFQDYLRQDGTVATPTVAAPGWQATPTSGFTATGTYWLRLDKDGTSYTGSWSADGESYTELFQLEDTGIDADYLVLDAYKTSTFSFGGDASWLFTLKTLEFEGGGGETPPPSVNKAALNKAIADAEAVDTSKYTDETVAAMNAALADARAAKDSEDQAVVDAAAAALNAAVEALELKPVEPPPPVGEADYIDFTNPADAEKFAVVNQDTAAIAEGEGLTLEWTADAFEPVSAGWNQPAVESAPKDLIRVPVSGDWTATLQLELDRSTVNFAFSSYFAFLAMQGDDYQNMVGVRASNAAAQDFLRDNGTITAGAMDSADVFGVNGPYWFRIEKEGTTYTCTLSTDGVEYSDLFVFEDTGIEADYLVIDAYKTSSMSFGGTASYQFQLKRLDIEKPASGEAYVLASAIEAGKQYVIVADGAYAMTNEEVPGKASYSGASTTRGAAAVEIAGDKIVSEVTDGMLWTFEDSTSAAAYDGMAQYWLRDAEGRYLRRGSMSRSNAALILDDALTATARYYTWSFKPYADGSGYAMYVNSERAYGSDYPGRVGGDAAGFDIPGGLAQRSPDDPFAFMNDSGISHITLYEKVGLKPAEKPAVASISVDGKAVEGFEPKLRAYAVAVAEGGSVPSVTAEPGNADTVIEVAQAEGVPGEAIVTATSPRGVKTYVVCFDYPPKDEYFADGALNEGQWTILNEVKDPTEEEPFKYYRLEKGMGLVMPTQHNSIYQKATPGAWSNMFTMSGGGDWEVVAKAFYPAVPQGNYQQVQFIAWQDEDNYVRINCQDSRQRIEPFYEKNGTAVNQNANALNNAIAAAEDGTMTMYFKINKTGSTYTISYSEDAKEWKSGGVYEAALTNVKVAVFCTQDYQPTQSNYLEPVELAFEYVSVNGLDGKTVRTDDEMLTWAAQNAADYIAAGLPDEASDLFAISAAPHGYGVTLSSSDPDVISEAGFVTPAAADKNVDVTVTVSQGDVSASAAKTIRVPGTGAATGRNIDFTNPADAEKFTVDNQTVSEIKEGEGFYMISTNEAIEDCKGQLSGDAANTPRDTVQVPVEGDWTATLYVKVDTSGSNGQYEFLCLYGMADYDNGVGIRAGNGSTVNFKEVNGVNESSTTGMKVQTGLTSGTDHWYRLEKAGTTYTGYLSEDGSAFEKVFTYEDTGIEATMIVIDAYSGRSVGYQYWLQSLTFEGEETPEEPIDPSIPIWENTQYSFAERAADLIARMSLAQKGSQLITTPAAAIPASSLGGGALNVPSTKDVPSYYWWCEALHGYNRLDSSSKGVYARNHEYEGIGQWGPDNAVSYPMSLTVGNTWNPDLYYTEALEVGDEIRELTSRNPFTGNAIDLNFYSPTVNLQRDPRWGRNEESYSEDPYLTARMASQYVQGLEGKDQNGNLLDPDGYYNAHSTIKHFVANNSEANRTNGGAVSSLNALRNYYMAPYRSIIKATNISSVMTAYSTFNGEPCSYSSYLMDTLLRQVYGFEGYFTSDCDSVGTMVQHTKFVNPRTGKTLTNVERLATALAHGEDLECIGGYAGVGNYGSYAATMVDAKIQTDKGLFTENTFDVSLMRLLTARIATGEFDEDLQLTKDAAARTQAQIAALGEGADISAIPYNQTPERLAILDQVNNEGVVMLQNKDNFLPLSIPASGEYKVVIVGAWQTNMYLGLYSAKSTNSYNHINIQKGITDAIKAKNPDATFTYITSDTVSDADKEAIQAADVCVVVGGANGSYSQEGRDRTSLAMANNQAAMFSQVGKWNPNTVAVMEYQGPLETYTFRDDVKAMLWSSFGGIHKGVGFGNIIVGNVNPSGKLTATWFRSAAELPPTLDYTLYSTDDQVGRTYMFYEGDGVDYPFGYGLSFTSYEYSNLKIDKTSYDANDTIKVSFNVKNTGSVAGKETAQLYIAQPGADTKVRPIRRLEGFEKVELQPGETKTVSLEVKIPDLAYYNEADDCYAVDTGAYQVQVGKDSASLGLTADFTVTGAMDVYPETLTVKANAVGDSEKGIEERLIYDVGAEINPQLTVAMNNEKLYGYIIADQQSLIKSMASTPLPEGMTFTYESNRPGVAKVAGGKILAAGPGVATITVTGTLDGRSVSADFVVYVESKPQALSITLDGEPLEGFEKDKYLYEVEVARGSATPVVAAVAASDALTLTVKQPASVPGIAEVIVTDPASGASETYQIGIGYKPVSTDFSEGLEAAKAKGWNFFYEDSEKYSFGEDGLTLTPKSGEFGFDVENPVANVFVESALGDWVAETTLTPAGAIGKTGATHRDEAGLIVYGDNGTSYRVVYNNRWNASNGVITYQNSRINVYLVVAGNDNNFSIANASVPAGTEKIHLRMIRTGNQCQAQYSTNGTTWTNIGNAEPLDTVLPQVGVFSRGNDFTATFDGLNILKVTDVRPQLSELCLDGQTVEGFEPGVYAYNLKLKEPTDHIPVITAAPADEDLKVEIAQFDAPTGVATVVVSSAYASATYSIALNYGPSYDYLADGADGTVKGKGFVPTADAKLTMPAMGTWAVVAKAFIPDASAFDGQSIGISVAESASNSVNINVQGANLLVQPSRTNNGRQSTYGYTTFNLTPAEDGSATVYFMIDKDNTSFTMYASADGKTFQRLGNVSVTYVNPTIELRGVQTGENPAAIEYVAVPAEDGFDAAVTDYFAWAAQCAAEYIAADLPAETSEDLALSPAPHGYTVTLASSDPAVISADGKVTPAAADKDVTVTVTVSDGAASGSAARTVHVPGAGAPGEGFVKVDAVEPGKTYIIVADGQYALNANEVPSIHSYANSTVTLGATPVTIEGDKIISKVSDDMLWTVQPAEDVPASYDGNDQYFVYARDGSMLLRKNGRVNFAPMVLGTLDPDNSYYATWSFTERTAAPGAYTMYSNSDRSGQQPMAVLGAEKGFELNYAMWSSWKPQTMGSEITFYIAGGEVNNELDYSALSDAISAADAVGSGSSYTAGSFAAFEQALADARSIAANGAASQAEIDAAAAALTAAMAGLKEKAPVVGGVWKLAENVEPGKTYVIVADGQYALNANEVPSIHSYANSTVTLGSTAVTVAGGKITSEITEDMLWTVQAADVGPSAQDGAEQYYVYARDGRQLLRKNVRVGYAPVVLGELNPDEIDYATWSFCKRAAGTRAADAAYTMYSNANSAAQWPLALLGAEKGFELNGKMWSEWEPQTTGSAIRLYTLDEGGEPVTGGYKITAPHVVKLSSTKAAAGETVTVTGDGDITDITVQTADGKDVPVTKVGNNFTFTMPEGDVTVKTYYAKTALAGLASLRQKGNPFIPIYDFNPDTEPHVWEDPDNPGQYRFYFLSSHDMDKVHYCSTNHVLYSCPVDDPFNWTYHGVIVGPENTEHDDILYAPDMGCVEDPTSPTGKYYYYYPCNQAGGRQTMVLRSSRPDGKGDPFTVVNWEDETHNRTTGSIMTFDPSIFVDDDGKVYGYWGGYNSTCHGAQLDPATNFTTAVEGTQLDDMLGDGLRGETFGFYEASSMRKIDGVYVFIYSRQGKNEEPEGANYNQLGYAYSDSPLGPWTFGGIVVDAQGEVLGWPESRERTFAGGNTHGSLVKLGDQWYVTYHRNVETYARQAMIEPIDVVVNEDGSVKITQAEMTSKGFYVNGLNPYAKVSIGTACFMTGNGKIQPLYEHDVESLPVINLRANSIVGLKYFDFNTEAPKGSSSSLKIDLVPKGVNAKLNVWLRPQSDLGVAPFSENCIKIGEYRLTSDLPKEKITIEIPTPAVDTVDGQWGVFYSFSDVESNGNIVELYDMQFEFADHEHDYTETVVAPTCLEGGYTLGTCKVCGKEVRYNYTKALGHAWDEGTVTVAPTTVKTGVMTYTCTRCGETMTKKLPRVGVVLPADIDFTDPADAVKYEIVNKDSAEVVEGEGVTLTPTADAFEPIGGGFGGGAATESEPKDLIKIPVSGNWIATTRVDFNQNDVQFAFNSYFSFLAMEGEDYQNMAGIRGTNNVFQDYLRTGGAVAAPTVSAPGWGASATSGFTANGPYWLRLEKAGTSYTAAWSADGENFTELFKLEDTGVDAEYLLLDAYKTSTFSFGGSASWLFTLKYLNFEDNENAPIAQTVDFTALEAAIAAAEAVLTELYTDESVAAMQAALADAKAALSSGDQATVDAAAAALNAAVAALETKPVENPDLEELYRLARQALARAEAARKTAEDALAAAEAAGGADLEALEAARAAAQAAQTAAEEAMIQAAAAQAAAAASDRSAAGQAALAADSAAYAAEQAAKSAQALAAAQKAQAAAEAAQAAAEAAKAAAAADQAAADAAKQAAEAAKAAAETAKQAALAADTDAAAQAAEAAAKAAEAARAQAEAAFAQAAAEAAEAAAKAAQAQAEAAQANAEADQAAAAAAKQAAESAKAAAENAKAAAEAAKAAAEGSNTAAAASAAKAAQAAADVAAALSQVAAAQAEIAEIKAQAEASAAQAAAAKAAAEAAQRAAEAAQRNADRYSAMTQLIAAAQAADVPEERQAAIDAALEAGLAAIEAAADKAAIDQALADALEDLSDIVSGAFRFDDVLDPAKYYFDPVYWAVDEGITTGTSANLFSPEKGCTRAQVVTFLWRAAGEPAPAKAETAFADVKADAYYAKAVAWAVEQGITKGTSETAFSPEEVCTRAQIVTFLWRAAGEPKASFDGFDFVDVRTDAYYYDAVQWAVEQGITKGTSADKFSPNDPCTRAQVVTFLYRAAQKEAN